MDRLLKKSWFFEPYMESGYVVGIFPLTDSNLSQKARSHFSFSPPDVIQNWSLTALILVNLVLAEDPVGKPTCFAMEEMCHPSEAL
jgi:hypothetical protein